MTDRADNGVVSENTKGLANSLDSRFKLKRTSKYQGPKPPREEIRGFK